MPGPTDPQADAFLWGAATAAYQIEGHPLADGAGACIWHEFSHTPGTTYRGHTGDLATDHYHRWPEDVALMRELGLSAYRFSIRWPRLLPEGVGRSNPAGLAFYDRLVDALLAAEIEPLVTLYHWDLPSALQYRGGWANRDSAGWFAEYAALAGRLLGDRVRRWITLNEPMVVAVDGHLRGRHAPGIRNVFVTARVIHHQLLGHVAAYRALKAEHGGLAVGITLSNTAVWPATAAAPDVEAAEMAHAWRNFPLFLEPLTFGRYPPELTELLTAYLPDAWEADVEAMRLPPDFVGLNYYSGERVRHDARSWLGFAVVQEPEAPRTAMGWMIRPEGIHRILTQAHARYRPRSVFVTENGAAFVDRQGEGGVHDPARTAYLRAHIREVLRAREEGVPVDGYFVWSLLDNFEWARGYARRFGIVYVNYPTQERVVKDSGLWYASFARKRTVAKEAVDATA